MPICSKQEEPHQLIEKFKADNVREAIEQISRRLEKISEDGLGTNVKRGEFIETKKNLKQNRGGGNWCFRLAKRTAKKRSPRPSTGSQCHRPK